MFEHAGQVAHVDPTGQYVLLRIRGASSGPNHEIATIAGRPIARFAAPRGMWIYRFAPDGRSLIAQMRDSSETSIWRIEIGALDKPRR